MKQKHIDLLREVRLWATQVVVPLAITFGVTKIANPKIIDRDIIISDALRKQHMKDILR